MVNLWQSLEYDELTVNMRQSSDQQYGDILYQVRIGNMTHLHFGFKYHSHSLFYAR